jgi:hypothetical protein
MKVRKVELPDIVKSYLIFSWAVAPRRDSASNNLTNHSTMNSEFMSDPSNQGLRNIS